MVAGVSTLNIGIPSIIDALEPSSTQTLWIVDGYGLVFAGLLLPAGAIGDRYGRKGALLIGLAIFAGGALWSAWAGDANTLIFPSLDAGNPPFGGQDPPANEVETTPTVGGRSTASGYPRRANRPY